MTLLSVPRLRKNAGDNIEAPVQAAGAAVQISAPVYVPAPSPMDTSAANIYDNWEYFRVTFENYIVAIDCRDDVRKLAILMSVMGRDCSNILKHLSLSADDSAG